MRYFQGFYTNTMVDLYDNVVGAAMGSLLYVRAEGRALSSRALASTETVAEPIDAHP